MQQVSWAAGKAGHTSDFALQLDDQPPQGGKQDEWTNSTRRKAQPPDETGTSRQSQAGVVLKIRRLPTLASRDRKPPSLRRVRKSPRRVARVEPGGIEHPGRKWSIGWPDSQRLDHRGCRPLPLTDSGESLPRRPSHCHRTTGRPGPGAQRWSDREVPVVRGDQDAIIGWCRHRKQYAARFRPSVGRGQLLVNSANRRQGRRLAAFPSIRQRGGVPVPRGPRVRSSRPPLRVEPGVRRGVPHAAQRLAAKTAAATVREKRSNNTCASSRPPGRRGCTLEVRNNLDSGLLTG